MRTTGCLGDHRGRRRGLREFRWRDVDAAIIRAPDVNDPKSQPSIPPELGAGGRQPSPNGEDVTLTLADTGYEVERGPERVHGGLSVASDQISFLRSSACDGVGRYRWSLAGARLTFVPLAPDQCPARTGLLVGQSYTLAAG